MGTFAYPEDITKSVYMTFIRKKSRGFKTSELQNIDSLPFETNTSDIIALPVPNNLSDSSSINYSDVQDTDVMGKVLNKVADTLGSEVMQESKIKSGSLKASQQLLLFDSVSLKTYNFSWDLIPENRNEAIAIENIIKQFEEAKLPSYILGRTMLQFPDVFSIKIKGSSNNLLHYLPSVLVSVEVSYSDGHYNEYEKGGYPKVILTLGFRELVSRTREIQQRLYK